MSNKRSLSFIVLFCSILLFRAAPVFGAHPLLTEDTFMQGKGKTQGEALYQYDHDHDAGVETRTSRPLIQITYGIIDPLDAVVTVPYLFVRHTQSSITEEHDGIGDIVLSLKWRFFGDKEGLQFAIKPSVTFPTGDEEKGMGFGREAYGITLISTFAREEWSTSANLGYQYNEYGLQSNRDACRRDIWSASLSGQYEIFENVWLVGEAGVKRNADVTSDTPPAYILGGFIYELTKRIDLDAGYKYGLNKPEADYSILAGITIRF